MYKESECIQIMQATMEEHLWKFVFVSPAIKYDSPFCRQEAITVNMAATRQEKPFCVLDYAQCKSVITVQRNFRRRFGKDSPTKKSITTDNVNSKPQGVCAKGSALAVPVFQRRTCSEFGKLSCVAQRSQSPKLLVNCGFHKPPSGKYYSESVYFFCENPVY
jgi:hypothetical protein